MNQNYIVLFAALFPGTPRLCSFLSLQGAWEQVQRMRLLMAEPSPSPTFRHSPDTFCHRRSSDPTISHPWSNIIRDSANSKQNIHGKTRKKPKHLHICILLHCSLNFLSPRKNTAGSPSAEVLL